MSDLSDNITAMALLVTAAGTIWNNRRIKEVKEEVKTANSQTLAQLADATETRRIDHIAPKNRTPLEREHLDIIDTPPQKGVE